MTWFFIGYLLVLGHPYEAHVIAPDRASCLRIHRLMQRQIDLGMLSGRLTDCTQGLPPHTSGGAT